METEYGTIEREVQVDASPETVFEVITSPEHLKEWWPDEAVIEPVPGARGELVFGDRSSGTAKIPKLLVVDAVPPRLFSFRWTDAGEDEVHESNSLLVTFELAASGNGTLLRMTESGFRERGWGAAVMEQAYGEHIQGWEHYLPRLVAYAATVRVVS
jgi:uncharacterized protein YndB with AHSA1/START domain